MFGQKVSAWLPDLLITVKATTVGRHKPLTIKVSQSLHFALRGDTGSIHEHRLHRQEKIFAKPIARSEYVKHYYNSIVKT